MLARPSRAAITARVTTVSQMSVRCVAAVAFYSGSSGRALLRADVWFGIWGSGWHVWQLRSTVSGLSRASAPLRVFESNHGVVSRNVWQAKGAGVAVQRSCCRLHATASSLTRRLSCVRRAIIRCTRIVRIGVEAVVTSNCAPTDSMSSTCTCMCVCGVCDQRRWRAVQTLSVASQSVLSAVAVSAEVLQLHRSRCVCALSVIPL